MITAPPKTWPRLSASPVSCGSSALRATYWLKILRRGDAGELGIDDVIVGDEVGDQRAHAR